MPLDFGKHFNQFNKHINLSKVKIFLSQKTHIHISLGQQKHHFNLGLILLVFLSSALTFVLAEFIVFKLQEINDNYDLASLGLIGEFRPSAKAATQTYYLTTTGSGLNSGQSGTFISPPISEDQAMSVAQFNNSLNWSQTDSNSLLDPDDVVYVKGSGWNNASYMIVPVYGITLDGWESGTFDPSEPSTWDVEPVIGNASRIHINVDGVTIRDLRFRSGGGYNVLYGISVGGYDFLTKVSNQILTNNYFYIDAVSGTQLRIPFITDSEISYNYTDTNVGERNEYKRWFSMNGGSRNKIIHNTIFGGITTLYFNLARKLQYSPVPPAGIYNHDPDYNMENNEIAYNTYMRYWTAQEGISFDDSDGSRHTGTIERDTVASINTQNRRIITLAHANWTNSGKDYSGLYAINSSDDINKYGQHVLIEAQNGAEITLAEEMPNLEVGDTLVISFVWRHNWVHNNVMLGEDKGNAEHAMLLEGVALENILENNILNERVGATYDAGMKLSVHDAAHRADDWDNDWNHGVTRTYSYTPTAFNIFRNNDCARIVSQTYHPPSSAGNPSGVHAMNNAFYDNNLRQTTPDFWGYRLVRTNIYIPADEQANITSNFRSTVLDTDPTTHVSDWFECCWDRWYAPECSGNVNPDFTCNSPTCQTCCVNGQTCSLGSFSNIGGCSLCCNGGTCENPDVPPIIPSPGACNYYQYGVDVPELFAASYNTLSTQHELLLRTDCDPDTNTVQFDVGNGSELQFIWDKAYFFRDGAWQELPLDPGNSRTAPNWILGSASASVRLRTNEMEQYNHLVAYVCTYQNERWNCGCHDQACNSPDSPAWNLQTFRMNTNPITPPPTCTANCCDACESGTEQSGTEQSGDCGGTQVCCGECYEEPVAVEYHWVTQNGDGGNGGDGSQNNPWSVAQFNNTSPSVWSSNAAADDLIGPGDTVYFSGNITSQINPQRSGAVDNFIILDGWEEGPCDPINVSTYNNRAVVRDIFNPIDIRIKNYLIVRDFEVTNWTGDFAIGGREVDNIQILSNYVHDAQNTGRRGIAFLGDPDELNTNIVVENNRILNIPAPSTSVGMGSGGSWWVGGIVRGNHISGCIDSLAWEHGSYILIENNFFDGKAFRGEDHIDSKQECNNFIVRFNKFYHHSESLNSYSGIQVQRGSHHHYIYANEFYDNRFGVMLYGGSTQAEWDDTDHIFIWSNIFRENMAGIHSTHSDNGHIANVWSSNNAFISNVGGDILDQGTMRTLIHRTGINVWGADSFVTRNSIFLNNNTPENDYLQSYYHDSAGLITNADNLGYYNGQIAKTYNKANIVNFESYGTNNQRTDPGLNSEYEPQSSSFNVIDSGASLSIPAEFSPPTIMGIDYSEEVSLDMALHPSTNWSSIIPHVVMTKQNEHGSGWERGAYVYPETTIQTCTDTTPYNTCVFDRTNVLTDGAMYCDNGSLVQNCIACPHCYGTYECDEADGICKPPDSDIIEAHYVTQGGGATAPHTGEDWDRAWSVAEFNNSDNWNNASLDDGNIGPGDTVFFSGIITTSVIPQSSGTSDNQIVMDGTDATLDFLVAPTTNGMIEIYEKSYITIQDFTIDGGYLYTPIDKAGIYLIDSSNIVIDNNDITETSLGVWLESGCSYLTITRNQFSTLRHSGIRGTSGTGDTYSSYVTIGGGSGLGNTFLNVGKSDDNLVTGFINLKGSKNLVISYNYGYSTDSTYGQLAIYGTNCFNTLTEYNTFVGADSYHNRSLVNWKGDGNAWKCLQHGPHIIRFNHLSNAYGDDYTWGENRGAIGVTYNWADVYIYGNYIHDCGWGIAYGVSYASQTGEDGGCDGDEYWQDGVDDENIYIFSNIVAETQGEGIMANGYGAGDAIINANVFNNTVYRAATQDDTLGNGLSGGWYPVFSRDGSIDYRLQGYNIQDHTYKNNLIMQSRPNATDYKAMWFYNTGAVNFDNNYNHFYDTRSEEITIGYSSTLYDWDGVTRPCGGNDTIGNPGVVNMAGRDFRLTSGSAVINNGSPMGTGNIATVNIQGENHAIPWGFALGPDTDFSGNLPVIDEENFNTIGRWDVGAYVYTDSSPSAGESTGTESCALGSPLPCEL